MSVQRAFAAHADAPAALGVVIGGTSSLISMVLSAGSANAFHCRLCGTRVHSQIIASLSYRRHDALSESHKVGKPTRAVPRENTRSEGWLGVVQQPCNREVPLLILD
jgi:hypothetical protein